MSKLSNAFHEIQTIDNMARRNQWINRIHPLVKLCITIFYMLMVVSYDKYNITGLLGMSVYPLILFELAEVSFRDTFYKLRIVLPLVCAVGIFNPIFDREPITMLFGITVTSGMLSMCTLVLKGIFTVLSSYLLIATTTIEELCYSLRLIHLPKLFVTQVLLTYRYISVLLSEANRITQAYSLRAPKQKGIQFKVWGSLSGQMLLRSIDRANELYQSMCLRGYIGEFYYEKSIRLVPAHILYLTVWLTIISIFRIFPIFELVGKTIM